MKSTWEGQLSLSARKTSAKDLDPNAIGPRSAVSDFGENCRLGNVCCINPATKTFGQQLRKHSHDDEEGVKYKNTFEICTRTLTPSRACMLNNLLGKALTVNSSVPGDKKTK